MSIKNTRIYDIGNGKFAIGFRGETALYVVRRILTAAGRGRPRYQGVRGRRPVIAPAATLIKPSSLLRSALVSALSI